MRKSIVRIFLVALLLLAISAPSFAVCYECPLCKSTLKGGAAWCTYIYNSNGGGGCATMNPCKTVSSFCDYDPSCDGSAALKFDDSLQMASVTTQTPAKAAAPAALTARN